MRQQRIDTVRADFCGAHARWRYYLGMGFEKTNPVSIESVLMSYLVATDIELSLETAMTCGVVDADALLSSGYASEEPEEHFSGPAMDDSEWASL